MSKLLKFQLWAALLLICSVPAHATIHNIDVGSFFFSPTKTVVNHGDTVSWSLVSGTHTTTSAAGSPKSWDSGLLTGTPFEVVFTVGDGLGPFPYLCSIHPVTMIDTIFVTIPTDINDELPQELPNSYSISQNYPNPFNLSTTIRYTLPARSQVTISIYNVMGQKVNTIIDETKSAGSHTVYWDGTDKAGKVVSSGVYFYRLQAGDFIESKRMMLIK